jgi:hypothetical protein
VSVVGRQVAQVLAQVLLVVMVANMVAVVAVVESQRPDSQMLGVTLKEVLLELFTPAQPVHSHQQIQVTCNELIY